MSCVGCRHLRAGVCRDIWNVCEIDSYGHATANVLADEVGITYIAPEKLSFSLYILNAKWISGPKRPRNRYQQTVSMERQIIKLLAWWLRRIKKNNNGAGVRQGGVENYWGGLCPAVGRNGLEKRMRSVYILKFLVIY